MADSLFGYDDSQPPKYFCYTIAWKLILNRKTAGRVTEEDLIVAPSDYWKESLKADLEDMLRIKKKRSCHNTSKYSLLKYLLVQYHTIQCSNETAIRE